MTDMSSMEVIALAQPLLLTTDPDKHCIPLTRLLWLMPRCHLPWQTTKNTWFKPRRKPEPCVRCVITRDVVSPGGAPQLPGAVFWRENNCKVSMVDV